MILKFFEKELAVEYLFLLHYIMSIFHKNVQEIEREINSVGKV
jgi:hypothetical protein